MTREDPDSHFIDSFISVGPTSPTSKIPHPLKFLALKTCPNCIGRSWNSSTERPERQLHSWTATFATKHFRRPSLHETFSHLCLQKTRLARFFHLRLYLYNQLKCQFLVKPNIFFWYGRHWGARAFAHDHEPTECLNKTKKCSTSRGGAGASYQTSHPGISARAIAFGRSWPFAAFCYRPRLPVRHWGRDMSATKPYETNPTPTHSSRPPLSLQFSLTFRWLIYSREKSFYLTYGKHWSRRLQSVRTRALLKVTYTHA